MIRECSLPRFLPRFPENLCANRKATPRKLPQSPREPESLSGSRGSFLCRDRSCLRGRRRSWPAPSTRRPKHPTRLEAPAHPRMSLELRVDVPLAALLAHAGLVGEVTICCASALRSVGSFKWIILACCKGCGRAQPGVQRAARTFFSSFFAAPTAVMRRLQLWLQFDEHRCL